MNSPLLRPALVLAIVTLATTMLVSCSRTGDGVPLASPDTGSPVNCVKSIVEYEKRLLFWFADNQIDHYRMRVAQMERELAFFYVPTEGERDDPENARYRDLERSIEYTRALIGWFDSGENRQKLKDAYKLVTEPELVEPPERDKDQTTWTEVSPETNQTVLVEVELSWPEIKAKAAQSDDPLDAGDFELKEVTGRGGVPVIGRMLHAGRYHVDVQRVNNGWRIADWRNAPKPEPEPEDQPD